MVAEPKGPKCVSVSGSLCTGLFEPWPDLHGSLQGFIGLGTCRAFRKMGVERPVSPAKARLAAYSACVVSLPHPRVPDPAPANYKLFDQENPSIAPCCGRSACLHCFEAGLEEYYRLLTLGFQLPLVLFTGS